MQKKIGLPLIALAGIMAFGAPRAAEARVHFGVAIGGPVYTAPVAPYPYGYGYAPPYVDPYYGPAYVAPAPYVAPYVGVGIGIGGGYYGGYGHGYVGHGYAPAFRGGGNFGHGAVRGGFRGGRR
jgi:hypothetical protein